ncbi:GumC family protein [Flavobacterium agrisoli]|uniref:Polysaccharide biosynthesis tyrosine autokinase n=1 Tax=Flavobacterium agrisoli TaxID=2793066 RepID=A0A934UIF4_9FLAO|nr:polysaccharide biosynthesis tyrosine autokinase [Flavobacterium agrisoli]MBK0368791.1 polysaccharide biosynthesis tyrosine autokinase [Flavobacterium agrisoli]
MDLKKTFLKYFHYWPWFLLSFIVFLTAAYAFIRITPPTYESTAVLFIDKLKDDKSKIITINNEIKSNEEKVENEIRLITSNEFLLDVVDQLNLNINYFEKVYLLDKGAFYQVPFVIEPTISADKFPEATFDIKINKDGFLVTNHKTQKEFAIKGYEGTESLKGLPFTIKLAGKARKNPYIYYESDYKVSLTPTAVTLKNLKSSLEVLSDEESVGTIELNHVSNNPIQSRKILNEIIFLLDDNIVTNKQKVFKNTVTFLNRRIKDFSKEKDSIKSVKEKYLQVNDISALDNYIVEKTADRSQKMENAMLNEKQIRLTNYAINDIQKSGITQTLGTDYNLEIPTVNQMLLRYNEKLMEGQVILERAQTNNPAYITLMSQLKIQRQEILNTLKGYLSFLNQTNRTYKQEQNIAEAKVRSIPTNDKILGNIDSDLSLKEETYTTLLQKREEAVLNGAILDSNIKTLNSPETNYDAAIFPQPKSFMLGAFMLAFLFPFGILYAGFYLNTKVHNGEDITEVVSNVPILGHIPKINSSEKLDNTATSHSIIAEATRALVSNLYFLIPRNKDKKGNVVLFTSCIQGEGKSFCAFHTAITISNLNKKVLLIGVDLRNPQLNDYFNTDKKAAGLTNYLANKNEDWKGFVQNDSLYSKNLDILFTGQTPPNPSQLISNSNFETLIEEARSLYDFIILDSAPVQIVSDTLNFSPLADVTAFVVKFDYTDKSNLSNINTFIKNGQLKNVGILINGVNMKTAYGYGYGVNYGYKYQEIQEKKPWYKRKQS